MAPEGQHVRIWAIWSLRANIGELSVERNPRLPLIIFFYLALLLVYKTRMHPLDQSDAKVKSITPWLSWNTWGSKAWAVLVPPSPSPRIPNFPWLLSLLGMRVTKTCCKLSFPNDSFCSYSWWSWSLAFQHKLKISHLWWYKYKVHFGSLITNNQENINWCSLANYIMLFLITLFGVAVQAELTASSLDSNRVLAAWNVTLYRPAV